MTNPLRAEVSNPLAANPAFKWQEPDFVVHFLALTDPVTQVNMRQIERFRLGNMPQDAIGAVTRVRIGLIKSINRRQAIVEHIEYGHHSELALHAIDVVFAKLNQT